MKKRMLNLMLALVVIVGIIQATAMTANAFTYTMEDTVYVGNISLGDGDYILKGETEVRSGKPSADASYAYFKDCVLYLKDYDITTFKENYVETDTMVTCGIGLWQWVALYWDDSFMGHLINDFPLTIHLTGQNKITDSNAEYSIYAHRESSVIFTGDGSLEMNRPMAASAGTTVQGGTIRMTESGANDNVSMIKTSTFNVEGGDLNIRASYRNGIECSGFTMSSGKLDITVLGNSQYVGPSGLVSSGAVSFAGGTVKIQADGDAVQCSSLSVQNGIESIKFISAAGSEQEIRQRQ